MKNNLFCKSPHINLYKEPSYKSKISSQIIYGEKFKILVKKKKFTKIKTSYDNYVGYIKSSNYINKFKPTHKICVLKSRIFKYPKKLAKYKTTDYLLLTGDPAIIGVACSIVSDITNGKYNLLKWDKQERKYYSITINLYEKGKIDE